MFKNDSLWQAVLSGGFVMLVLVLCSILSIAIILEKVLYFYRRSRVSRAAFMQALQEQLGKEDLKKAIMLCQEAQMPFAAVVGVGLNSSHSGEKEMTEAMERQIVIEISDLERRTSIVGTIGSTAVYIGLFGTVWGIIETFQDIYQAGSSGISVVIHGISEALVCTAAGLFVAIPAIIAYNYFIKRINGFVTDMELCASETSSLLKGKKKLDEKNLQDTRSHRRN